MIRKFLILVALFAVQFSCGSQETKKDAVVKVSKDDAEMTAAFKAAKDNILIFDNNLGKEGVHTAIKVAFPHGDDLEYCWVTQVKKVNDQYIGKLDSEPNNDIGHKRGDAISVGKDRIVDWIVMAEGPALGNYTLRALFKKMSDKEVQDAKKAMHWVD
jgi:uncharacterized protein YegJ (DUF2314 family)